MPKIVDHQERRAELAEAVWRVIDRDGVDGVSIRSVAAEAGWSPGALRHYFATRAELLAFACEEVIARVTARVSAPRQDPDVRRAVREILLETMPVDAQRTTEASVAFSFLALGLSDPHLAEVQRVHFDAMHELCQRLVELLDTARLLAPDAGPAETLARRLHALVDGLSIQRLARHLTAHEMTAQLDAYLSELMRMPRTNPT
ncbi:transcriptional regulator BetI [Actinomadura rubteroloni]|uniref:Transcriptional regulator BetI n=1 Tax=Actinomadura rubteroloni TaxID=1926885 RepID=A0A2P4UQM3_9ACTN|nr:TetR family transcriptional regulator C-terminal domain-containing protein [Actinomadura rubteroloni]POM27348.1 transcriptional regulator BetI [Actinomadura rubteroloni]